VFPLSLAPAKTTEDTRKLKISKRYLFVTLWGCVCICWPPNILKVTGTSVSVNIDWFLIRLGGSSWFLERGRPRPGSHYTYKGSGFPENEGTSRNFTPNSDSAVFGFYCKRCEQQCERRSLDDKELLTTFVPLDRCFKGRGSA